MSMLTSTFDLVMSFSSMTTKPLNFSNTPLTLVIIMCFTLNSATLSAKNPPAAASGALRRATSVPLIHATNPSSNFMRSLSLS